jgi:hypothetical protein
MEAVMELSLNPKLTPLALLKSPEISIAEIFSVTA